LNEEWARRETLERLQEEQKSMLESERKKREEFERQQNEKETQLRGEQQLPLTLTVKKLRLAAGRWRY
jgi:hypothetical protein